MPFSGRMSRPKSTRPHEPNGWVAAAHEVTSVCNPDTKESWSREVIVHEPWINPDHFQRYRGNHVYRTMARAEIEAERASKRTGELILAYTCFSCRRVHIGHADLSQQLARVPHVARPCQRCQAERGREVTPERFTVMAAGTAPRRTPLPLPAKAFLCHHGCRKTAFREF